MNNRPAITDLPSQYLLMATADRTGNALGYHHHGFGAAILVDMAMNSQLQVEKGLLFAVGDPPDDELYRFIWTEVRDAARPRKVKWWVHRLSGNRYRLLRRLWTNRLVEAGVLRHEIRSFLVWSWDRYPSNKTGMEDQLRERIRKAIANRDATDSRLLCLVGILTATYSLKEVASGRERRILTRQAKKWIKSDPYIKPLNEIVHGIMAAIFAATASAAVAASG